MVFYKILHFPLSQGLRAMRTFSVCGCGAVAAAAMYCTATGVICFPRARRKCAVRPSVQLQPSTSLLVMISAHILYMFCIQREHTVSNTAE